MKCYGQFLVLSTGCIEGSLPPEFRDGNKKPIDKLGSDGVCYIDARLSLENKIDYINEQVKKHINKNSIVGFEIRKANNFSGRNETIIFRCIFK